MNLICDAWIPVRRRSGETGVVAPWQLTDRHREDPIIAVHSTRADFDGALIQFLIGLLQTAVAPRDHGEWLERFETPPSTATLRARLAAHAAAFELQGDGFRFMQQRDLDAKDSKEISGLLIDSPGETTVRNNLDHFVKRGRVEALCPACTAAALFCLQTNGPAGGVGYRTSVRGGGPLTTLVISDASSHRADGLASLWRNCWLNILDAGTLVEQSGNVARSDIAAIFPWMAQAPGSESGGPTTPVDAHPLQMYWGMPRRIQLLPPIERERGQCDLCRRASEQLFTRYTTKNYGINYEGRWRHPLSPYDIDERGVPIPVHPQPGGLSYRHWPGLMQAAVSKRSQREPAAVVQLFIRKRAGDIEGRFCTWAFGYDMQNAKARCWYEATMPLHQVASAERERFEANAARLVQAARLICGNLRSSVQRAWFRRPGDKSEATTFITMAFWRRTEARFYDCLSDLQSSLAEAERVQEVHERWLRYLRQEAEGLFDQWALASPIESSDPRRVAVSRHELGRFKHGSQTLEEHNAAGMELRSSHLTG